MMRNVQKRILSAVLSMALCFSTMLALALPGAAAGAIDALGTYKAELSGGYDTEVYDALVNTIAAGPVASQTVVLQNLLTSNDQADYDEAIKKMVDGVYAFSFDYPQAYWFGKKFETGGTSLGSSVQLQVKFLPNEANPAYTAADDNTLKTEIAAIVAAAGKQSTDYDKVKAVHDYLKENVKYTNAVAVDSNDRYFSVVGALVDKEAVCEGYAKAFKMALDELGIPCVVVPGKGNPPNSTTEEPHMWNYVKMDDGNWYAVDVTWDADLYGIGNASGSADVDTDSFFLIGADTPFEGVPFLTSHTEERDPTGGNGSITFQYPTISQTAYDPAAVEDPSKGKVRELQAPKANGTLATGQPISTLDFSFDGEFVDAADGTTVVTGTTAWKAPFQRWNRPGTYTVGYVFTPTTGNYNPYRGAIEVVVVGDPTDGGTGGGSSKGKVIELQAPKANGTLATGQPISTLGFSFDGEFVDATDGTTVVAGTTVWKAPSQRWNRAGTYKVGYIFTPTTGNYNLYVGFIDVVVVGSPIGGGTGGRSSGSSSGSSQRDTDPIATNNASVAAGGSYNKNDATRQLANIIAKNKGKKALVLRVKNRNSVDLDTLKALQAQAAKAGVKNLTITFQQTENETVARLALNPAQATKNVKTGVSTTSVQAQKIRKLFGKNFKNNLFVLSTTQRDEFGQTVTLSTKLPKNFDAAEVQVYSYNSSTKSYDPVEGVRVTKGGYVQFSVTTGGDYVVSTGRLR